MGFSSAEVRKFLLENFSDEEIEVICFDHFRGVTLEFSTGMSKVEKVSRLIEYIQRRNLVQRAFLALQAERPEQFKECFGDTIPKDVDQLFNTLELGENPVRSLNFYATYTDEIENQHLSALRGSQRIAAAIIIVGVVIAASSQFIFFLPKLALPREAWIPLFVFGFFTCSMSTIPVIDITRRRQKIELCNHARLLVKKITFAYQSGDAMFGTSTEPILQQIMAKIAIG